MRKLNLKRKCKPLKTQDHNIIVYYICGTRCWIICAYIIHRFTRRRNKRECKKRCCKLQRVKPKQIKFIKKNQKQAFGPITSESMCLKFGVNEGEIIINYFYAPSLFDTFEIKKLFIASIFCCVQCTKHCLYTVTLSLRVCVWVWLNDELMWWVQGESIIYSTIRTECKCINIIVPIFTAATGTI